MSAYPGQSPLSLPLLSLFSLVLWADAAGRRVERRPTGRGGRGDRWGEAGEEVRRRRPSAPAGRAGLGAVILVAASRFPLFSFSPHHNAHSDMFLHTAELLSAAKSAASNKKKSCAAGSAPFCWC
uniref:Uncharacterized protein n=1 Tax=Oryza meridionalis TaxID=40149 RepID=A0A0E0D2Z1_9ORYZ